MVLGMKSKHKKRASIRVEYIIHIEEIRPWPPSESLRSVQTVLLLWENGDQNSGSFLSVAGDSNIVFNESFMLPLTLYRDKREHDKFKKNYLEFSLVEPRKDKPKGHVLGTASINLADYGLNEDIISIDAPLNFKKSSNNLVQSALTISLEPLEKDSSNSSYNDLLSKDASLDNDDDGDVSEVASFTDDDASSQSSRTAGSFEASPSQYKDGYGNAGMENVKARNDYVPFSKFSERSKTSVKNFASPLVISSPTSVSFRDTNGKFNNVRASFGRERASYNSLEEELQSEDVLKNDSRVGPRPVTMRSDTFFHRKAPPIPTSKLKHVKSVNLHGAVEENGYLYTGGKPPDLDIPRSSQKKGRASAATERKEAKVEISDGKNEWKSRIETLEEELRETAAMEVGLYSVVSEHSSSVNKVHAPARRLSRFYINACRVGSQAKRASAARAAVSGLVVVSKACGYDVPRLTFWLSNSIMLRAIISQTAAELPHYNKPGPKSNDVGSINESDDWEDVLTFIIALEKVESWLFSRIVESLWWQTLTPPMQPTVKKSSSKTKASGTKKTSGRKNTLKNLEQVNFSMELWKKAFKDACERLCPIRAGGHECGCLSVLVKLVMEQLVNRLDVAMFNAILRDCAEDMPTDPISDPICDSEVLPIPAGKSSFTAGAQLKNAIGNWSRWLTDLFGLEDDSAEAGDIYGDVKKPKSFKSFRLLHGLSDLMMLPFGMLADVSTRKEVCPTFGPVIIKRVLNNFVPDEFSPNPIPQYIIDALNLEEISGSSGESNTNFPCSAIPTKYSPPAAALLTCVGEVGSQVLQSSRLSTLKKSYTSDDEVDELDSPLTSIVPDSYQSSSALKKLSLMPKEKGGRDVVRYKLLKEIWRDDE